MNKIASRSEQFAQTGAALAAVFEKVGIRLLLLLLFAEAPLIAFTVAIAFQNGRLRASDALSQAASLQHATLSQVMADIRIAAALASAAGRLPASLIDDTASCNAVLQTLVAPNADRIAQALVLGRDGSRRCGSSAVPLPDMDAASWAHAALGTSPVLLVTAGKSVMVGARLVGSGEPGLVGIRLRETLPDLPVLSRNVPHPHVWLYLPSGWIAIGPAQPGDLPSVQPETAALLSGPGLRAKSRDGRDFLYSAWHLPPELGEAARGSALVVGSDIRAAATATSRTADLRVLQLAGFFLGEFILIIAGVSVVVSAPLRRLGEAVRQWRETRDFDAAVYATDPGEVRELKASFSRAAQSLNEREAELRGAIEQQDLLMQEIHHRVKNNLQIIASLLNLQAGRIKAPEARAEFQSARDRVRALATLHRHLYADGELHMIDLRAFFAELCSQLFQAQSEQDGDRIRVEVTAPEIEISSDQAVPIALIVTETVGNALKFAFPGNRCGTIRLSFTTGPQKAATLIISDDGIGLVACDKPQGLGLQLVRGFARQLGATLDVSKEAGTCYRVDMTLQRHRKYQPGPGTQRSAAPA